MRMEIESLSGVMIKSSVTASWQLSGPFVGLVAMQNVIISLQMSRPIKQAVKMELGSWRGREGMSVQVVSVNVHGQWL